MAKEAKITRLKLSGDGNDSQILLTGIVSTAADYQLSLALNKALNISLTSIAPVIINKDSAEATAFNRFADHTSIKGTYISLIANHCENTTFIKKFNNIDFWLHILHDNDNGFIAELLTHSIRKIKSVTAVFNIDAKTIKDKNILLLLP